VRPDSTVSFDFSVSTKSSEEYVYAQSST
jgi:hypothetical protein